ncbi:MAG: protein translocase subunit SecD [Spirochaetes bacterium]|nr:protein translocase subunit SecD [Spirochaetota bacterium]
MNKTKRFLLVLVVIGIALAFLFPSIKWYFLTPREDRALAVGTREQIRDYAWRMASTDLVEIEKLAKNGDKNVLPEKYEPLLVRARKQYRFLKKPVPATWDAAALLAAYESRRICINDFEDYYRTKILGLKQLQGSAVQLGLDLSGGLSVIIRADLEAYAVKLGHALSDAEREDAMSRAMEVLNSRIDKFGLTEPVIRRQGQDGVYVEIPGTADPERINSIIMGRGRLAFHIVDTDATEKLTTYLQTNPNGVDENLKVADPSVVPAGFIVRKFFKRDRYGLDEWTGTYLVITETAGLDGNHIQRADVSTDPVKGTPVVNFVLDKEGGELFYALTSSNVKKYMTVVLDDRVKSYAQINEAIRESVQMSGFNVEEAQNLARVLRTAALPIELSVASQQSIGASLGEDAIEQGKRAVAWGLALVFAFMFVYYKFAGINAMVAQVLNLYIMLSILSAFNLTLTLPSIAGFLLTVGMSVDANVIIFERIKEELRLGKGRRASIAAGFDKAFWAVMDSNITTIIAALFLAQLGSGPIQGFAVSLAIGNISSLFTSLFVSKLIFDFGTDVLKSRNVSISWRIR